MRHFLACAISFIGCLGFVGPSRADDGDFDSKGVKIRYLNHGRGEAVILIHGFAVPSAEEMWIKNRLTRPEVLPALEKDFRAIALECRGHGKSGKPHDPKDYGVEMAEDVIRLMDHLKIEKAHVVGYSMGAAIAGKLLVDHPDRLLSVTFAGGAPIVEPPKEFLALVEEVGTSLEKDEEMGAFLIRLTPPGEKPPTVDQARAFSRIALIGQDPKALAAVIRSLPKLEVKPEELKANRVPVAFIYGSKEAEGMRAQIDSARKYLNGATVTVVEGGDHITTPAKPEFRKAVLDFVRAHSAK